jgi:thioredoxin-related protein
MKKLFFVLICIIINGLNNNTQGQIKFYPKDFNAAVRAAKALDKFIFVEFQTSWCINCKKMEKDVFTDYELGDFVNENYLALTLDAEKFEVMELCEKYEIKSYPTILILDKNGKLINKLTGYYGVLPLTAAVKNPVYEARAKKKATVKPNSTYKKKTDNF